MMTQQRNRRKRSVKQLESRDDVSEVKYVSADDAWAEFQKDYFGDNPELAEGFKDDNPLAQFR